ncbi:MAG: DEAD/DEAH box helicase, partial [Candidatus Sericytochromatia bacterium]|nr:DEAD/DEAH box helicase [Candidatus Sericytochromatia bacterium]
MTSSFEQFNLSPSLLKGLVDMGITTPTPVQEAAIPLVMEGRDAIVQAKTGSGKTLAFGLPILSTLKSRHKPQALVVLPTRELAIQVCESLARVSKDHPLKTIAIYGGVGLGPQENALRRGVDMVVGTPGRLKDLLSRGSLNLSEVKILILDEADEMLDMGFRRDIEFLLERLPAREQTLIFSATMPEAMENIARKYMNKPAVVKLIETEKPNEIAHFFVRVSDDDRIDALISLLQEPATER